MGILSRQLIFARERWQGIAICGVLGFATTFVSEHQGGPQLLYALLFGMVFNFWMDTPRLATGADFVAKTVLRVGVALLGVRISLAQLTALGWWITVIIVLIGVSSTMLIGVLLARSWIRADAHFGLLTGGAVGICGASAAMALSAVLPQNKDNEQQTLLTVVGAGMLYSPGTADIATVVKLLRVALLVPVVLIISLYYRLRVCGSGRKGSVLAVMPMFLLGFVALVLLNSAGSISTEVATFLGVTSRWCLMFAIAALGVRSSLSSLATLGWRPIALLGVETVWLAALVLSVLWWMSPNRA
ncbi:putative sulfate exporter family transporter [Polaromonas sp. P1(28)-13]|nr:putative sulfate exporter family transporter [Polaromonas sp. P1(28)-13]